MGDRTSDAELVALARSRNREAFGILVERHQPMVQRVAFGVVGQRSIAEELANEAMLQAYLSWTGSGTPPPSRVGFTGSC